jgi:hypothetical protein
LPARKTDLFLLLARCVRRATLVPLVVLSLALAGCGDSVKVGTLSGKVTYKGKPLEFGSVTLQPVGGGPLARGTIQSDGTYTVTTDGKPGAPLGMNKVRVTCYSGQRPGANSSGGEMSLGDSLIPEHYTKFSSSGLEVEVKAGENPPYNIDL